MKKMIGILKSLIKEENLVESDSAIEFKNDCAHFVLDEDGVKFTYTKNVCEFFDDDFFIEVCEEYSKIYGDLNDNPDLSKFYKVALDLIDKKIAKYNSYVQIIKEAL